MKEQKRIKDMNMLEGSLWNKIILFAMPLAASSILQQLFNAADVAVVGKFAGNEALAAVGANAPVINLLVGIFVGLSVGSNVVIASAIGQGNELRTSKAVHTSIVLSVLGGVLLTVVGIIFARPILQLISTPPEVIDLAVLYLRIYFLGMPFMLLYNFASAILRSKGDTKRPLIILTISGVINVLLNLFFVLVCDMSVDGVATATVISNVISSALLIWLLIKETGAMKLELRKLKIDGRTLAAIAKIGVPAGLQGMVFSFSNVCIQSAINGLGEAAMGASAAALNYEFAAYYVVNAFGQANVTFIGQNYGAGNIRRCRSVCRWCMLLGFIATAMFSGLFILFRYPLLGLFTSDPAIAELGAVRLLIILSFEVVNMVIELLSGGMRGYGFSLTPALICIVGICGVRIAWVYTLFPQVNTFSMLMSVFPVSWIITAAVTAAAYMIVIRRIRKKHEMQVI